MKHIGITGGSQSFGAGDVERPNSPPARPLHRFQSVVVPGDSVGEGVDFAHSVGLLLLLAKNSRSSIQRGSVGIRACKALRMFRLAASSFFFERDTPPFLEIEVRWSRNVSSSVTLAPILPCLYHKSSEPLHQLQRTPRPNSLDRV